MPRKGENIYKRKDGRWEARYIYAFKEDGSPRYRSIYAADYLTVKKKQNDAKRKMDPRLFQSVRMKKNISFYGLLWLERLKPSSKESTYVRYHYLFSQPTKQLAHLLPGYIFFVSDHPQELQKLLKRIPEFAKTLGDDDGAIPLYQEEVEFLQRYTGDERILKMSEGYLVGSELVVTDGPLKDYQGKVMKIDRHKRTAVLELEFLGREMKVTVGLEVVRKV